MSTSYRFSARSCDSVPMAFLSIKQRIPSRTMTTCRPQSIVRACPMTDLTIDLALEEVPFRLLLFSLGENRRKIGIRHLQSDKDIQGFLFFEHRSMKDKRDIASLR